MNQKTAKVVLGFTQLNTEERAEAIRELNRFIEAEAKDRKPIQESMAKSAGVDLGPTNTGSCPCCGK